jgi:hypothetical protein
MTSGQRAFPELPLLETPFRDDAFIDDSRKDRAMF